jgi:hypothetical protein
VLACIGLGVTTLLNVTADTFASLSSVAARARRLVAGTTPASSARMARRSPSPTRRQCGLLADKTVTAGMVACCGGQTRSKWREDA